MHTLPLNSSLYINNDLAYFIYEYTRWIRYYCMKYSLPFFLFTCSALMVSAQTELLSLSGKDWKSELHISNGMLHGAYTSYYPNGNERASGQFDENIRVGTWHFIDSTGTNWITNQYDSTGNFQYAVFSFDGAKPDTIRLSNSSDIQNELNKSPKPIFSKRIWRYVDLSENKDRDVMKVAAQLENTGLSHYNTLEDLNHKSNAHEGKEQQLPVVGFSYVVDVVYVPEYRTYSSAIIAVSPAYESKSDKDYASAYYNYNELMLDGCPFGNGLLCFSNDLQSHHCATTVVKEANVFDKTLEQQHPEGNLMVEQWKVEVNLIEQEHVLWLITAH